MAATSSLTRNVGLTFHTNPINFYQAAASNFTRKIQDDMPESATLAGNSYKGSSTNARINPGHDLHPCCANHPLSLFSDNGMEIHLRKEVSSNCLKCQRKENFSWFYASKVGEYCYHVACMKEACLDNRKKDYFPLDVAKNKNLVLQNLAPKEVACRDGGQSSKAKKESSG